MLLHAINNNKISNNKNDNNNYNNNNNKYKINNTMKVQTMLIAYIKWFNKGHGKCFKIWSRLDKIVKWDMSPDNIFWIKRNFMHIMTHNWIWQYTRTDVNIGSLDALVNGRTSSERLF